MKTPFFLELWTDDAHTLHKYFIEKEHGNISMARQMDGL